MPFTWRENNCAFAVAEWVAAMTGVDLSVEFRGRVGSAGDAERVLAELGYGDLCSLVAAHFDEIKPVMARMGDIAALPGETAGWVVGIVLGERITVLRPDGLGTLPRSAMTRAFKVPG